MGDENPNAMNFDLNLGTTHDSSGNNELGSGSYPNTTINFEDSLDGPLIRIREALGQRRQLLQSVWGQFEVLSGTNLASEFFTGSSTTTREGSVLQIGEGSVAAEERRMDVTKTGDDNSRFSNDEALAKKDDEENCTADAGSFFDCRICLDLAKDPVVTCCGHLFCWSCLYRWLHVHSVAKECPVCKGEVTIKNLTPINGHGKNVQKPELNTSLKIPLRPQARRVESWREAIQKAAFTVPMEEMIRRLGRKFDLSQVHPHNVDASRESPERSNSLLNRILTSRGMRREQNNVISPNDVVDLTQSSATITEVGESRGAAVMSHLTSPLHSAERLLESDFSNDPVYRNPELHFPVDDRNDFLSIADDIQSEIQTVDSAIGIDYAASLITSSSRRRDDTSRYSEVDSGDSRALRRRRLG